MEAQLDGRSGRTATLPSGTKAVGAFGPERRSQFDAILLLTSSNGEKLKEPTSLRVTVVFRAGPNSSF